MKTAPLISPELTPVILVHTGATPATSIGLVQGEPQRFGTFDGIEFLFGTPLANMIDIAAIVMSIMAGLLLLTGRSNWRLRATLILAWVGLYSFAALNAIHAMASTRR